MKKSKSNFENVIFSMKQLNQNFNEKSIIREVVGWSKYFSLCNLLFFLHYSESKTIK